MLSAHFLGYRVEQSLALPQAFMDARFRPRTEPAPGGWRIQVGGPNRGSRGPRAHVRHPPAADAARAGYRRGDLGGAAREMIDARGADGLNAERVGGTAPKICSPPIEADELLARRPLKPTVDPRQPVRIRCGLRKSPFADRCEASGQSRRRLGPQAHREREATQKGTANHVCTRHVVFPIGLP